MYAETPRDLYVYVTPNILMHLWKIRKGLGRQVRFPRKIFAVYSNFGGMGDMVSRLAVFKYILDTTDHVSYEIYWHDYFVEFARWLLPEGRRVRHHPATALIDVGVDRRIPFLTFNPKNTVSSMSRHLVSHACDILLDKAVPLEQISYPQAPRVDVSWLELPESYIVVSTGKTSDTREWLPEEINRYVSLVKTKLELPVVFLGKRDVVDIGAGAQTQAQFSSGVDYSVGIDLRDKTSLQEAVGVIQNARAVVGVDNGIIHLAGLTDTPIVAGFTSVAPEHRVITRRGVPGYKTKVVYPAETLTCRGCQSNFTLVSHDYRECFYKNLSCLSYMSGVAFYKATVNALEDR